MRARGCGPVAWAAAVAEEGSPSESRIRPVGPRGVHPRKVDTMPEPGIPGRFCPLAATLRRRPQAEAGGEAPGGIITEM
jgi:hypothetical protein